MAPLLFEHKRFVDPAVNPYFRVANIQCFLAIRAGEAVGTIAPTIIPKRIYAYRAGAPREFHVNFGSRACRGVVEITIKTAFKVVACMTRYPH